MRVKRRAEGVEAAVVVVGRRRRRRYRGTLCLMQAVETQKDWMQLSETEPRLC